MKLRKKKEDSPALTDELRKINKILESADPIHQPVGEYRVDTMRHPYFQFSEKFKWPAITVTKIEPEQSRQIVNVLHERLPSFIAGCHLLPEPHPRKDSNQLHFVRPYKIKDFEYIYMLKISAEYMGGAAQNEIYGRVVQGRSPSFLTDRIYYSVRFVPVEKIEYYQNQIIDFEPRRLNEAIFEVTKTLDVRNRPDHISTMAFDEVDFSRVENQFSELFSFSNDWSADRLFRPFSIEYLTLCMNLIIPLPSLVDFYAEFFDQGLRHFIESGSLENIGKREKKFWSEYFSIWSYERSLSRSGNPHWLITKYPTQEWIKNF